MKYTLGLEKKKVLITGAAGGIGRECAKGYLENGADVLLCDFDSSALEKAADELRKEFPAAEIFTACSDLTKEGEVKAVLDLTQEKLKTLDILVNNAGVAHDVYSMNETKDGWERVIEINLNAQFFFTQQVFNRFWGRKRGGKVVFMASLSAFIGVPGAAAYSASKGAVLQLTKSLAGEWARFGVQVNCVCPGFVETPLIEKQLANERWCAYMNMRIPQKRLAKPQDIVGSVLFFSSDLSDYITGTSIIVDGGYSACG